MSVHYRKKVRALRPTEQAINGTTEATGPEGFANLGDPGFYEAYKREKHTQGLPRVGVK